jgi:hypothetical protein
METLQHAPRIQERIRELQVRLDGLKEKEFQVDDLGNPDNEPRALFDILGDDVANLHGFDLGRINQARRSGSNRAESASALLDSWMG